MFVTSLSASCNTMRKSKQLHLDPGKIAVKVVSACAAHPSNCTRLWCSKYPHSTSNVSWAFFKMRCPRPHHWKTDPLESFRQNQDQCCRSLTFCLLPVIQTTPGPSRFPHTVRSAPPLRPSVAPHSIRCVYGHGATSGTPRASHHRIIVGISAFGRPLVTFFGVKKNIVVQAFCGLLPLCSTFSKNSSTSRHVSLANSSGTFG